jgi:hypothetical protein
MVNANGGKKYIATYKKHSCVEMAGSTNWQQYIDEAKNVVIMAAVIAIVGVLAFVVSRALPGLPMPAAAVLLMVPGINFFLLLAVIYRVAMKK